ncbi:MAG: ABC transporter ATP-binding protein [Fusobacteria bacterium]|nr:ABC transporter ATP-binding protein [Fusobacteriota bacterium]
MEIVKENRNPLRFVSPKWYSRQFKTLIKSRSYQYFKPYLWLSIISVLLMTVYSVASGAPTLVMKELFNGVLVGKNVKMLIWVVVLIIVSTVVKDIANYCGSVMQSYISTRIAYDLRKDLYNHMIDLPMSYFKKNQTGDLMSRYTTAIPAYQGFLGTAFSFISKIIQLIAYFGIAIYTSWQLTISLIILLPVIYVTMKYLGKRLYKTGKKIQEAAGSINNFVQEMVSGVQVVKSFAAEDFERENYEYQNHLNFAVNYKNSKINARVSPITDSVNSIAIVVLLLLGGYFIIRGWIQSGNFIQLVVALGLTATPIRYISQQYGALFTNMAGVERVFEVLDVKNEITDKEDAKILENPKGKVEIKNAFFKYEPNQEWIINDITITANPGETVALVGKSGGGKSTLVNLLPRFYDIEKGSICVDGVDIRDYTQKSLRQNIGLVPQDTFLFSGSIRSNIAYGLGDIPTEKIIEAAKNANAWEFIEGLPDGLDTVVGERGTRLSGGQKQRISIARALLKNPKILILDEATSALDTESEKLVQDALDRLMQSRTTFVIAHRLSTIIDADKIAVIKGGILLEMGTHKELLANKGYYKELYDRQFRDE